mgnify:CR=1 FL=1
MAPTPSNPGGPPRFLLVALTLAALFVLAAGALLAFALREGPRGVAGSVLGAAIGGPFRLVDQDGRPVTEADLKGKWQLVFFGYTHCPDTCPTTLNEIALAFDRLGEKRRAVGVVFITVDPERDTPAVLKSYLASFDAPVVALTGTPAEIADIAKHYHVYYARHPRADGGYDMDHSAIIYVMDPQGRFTATLTPDNSAEEIAARLDKLLS